MGVLYGMVNEVMVMALLLLRSVFLILAIFLLHVLPM